MISRFRWPLLIQCNWKLMTFLKTFTIPFPWPIGENTNMLISSFGIFMFFKFPVIFFCFSGLVLLFLMNSCIKLKAEDLFTFRWCWIISWNDLLFYSTYIAKNKEFFLYLLPMSLIIEYVPNRRVFCKKMTNTINKINKDM